MATSDVAIDVLGSLVVRRGDDAVSVGGPRPRALLLRLVAANELVATDRLVEDLWAGEPPRSAVNTLQTYVSMLRRALGDVDQAIVVRDGPGYRLASGSVEIDADRFRSAVAAARSTDDPAERLRLLDLGLELWRGPAFVEVADAEWARPIVNGLEEARLAAVEDRFDALLALGHHGLVAAELPAVVDEHPLRERLAGQLVLALYRSGRQADALRAYDRTREVLIEELGLEPGPELAALQRAVLEQDPSLDLAPSAAIADRPAGDRAPSGRDLADQPASSGAPAEHDLASRLPTPLPAAASRGQRRPMVGRAEQLTELEAAMASTRTGARLVIVSGEPGIGKTRLAAALAASVHEDGGTVLWGSCPRDAVGPYQPFAGALREHLRLLPGRAASQVLIDLEPLATLLPDGPGQPSGSTDPTLDRYRLFDAVAHALSTLAASGGALLVLDDLHWADPDTCSLLGHVLRHDASPGPLVVATVRSHDAEPNPPLIELIADLQRDRLVSRLALDGLSVDAVGQLAAGDDAGWSTHSGPAGDAAGPDADADALHRATGGNPYFVEELLATRRDLGSPDAVGGHDQVPESIRDVLQARFQRLGEPVRSVIELAALVGAEFDLSIVDRAGDVHGDDLLDRVDRAVDAGLLIESRRVLGRYSFAHELVRQALADGHSATRRARWHLRIADALDSSDAAGGAIDTSDVPAAVAHHRLAALPLGDASAALASVLVATRHAVERLAFGDACATAELAVSTFDRIGVSVPLAAHAELLIELGRARRGAGDLSAATETFREAVDLARRAARPDLEADAVLGVVGPRPTGTRLDYEPPDPALLAIAEHALAALDDDPHRRAALLAARVWLLPRSGPIDERLQPVDEALAVARGDGDLALEARVLLARHAVLLEPDHLDQRIDVVLAAVDAAVDADAADIEVLARTAAATDLLERADLDAMRAQVARMTALADRIGQPAFRFHPGTFAVLLALLEGDHVAAEAQAFAMFEATKVLRTDVAGETALVSRLYQIARDRGTMPDLFPMLAAQLEGSRQPYLNSAYALAAAEVGEDALAAEQLALVLGDDPAVEVVPREGLWMGTMASVAETAAILGDGAAGAALAGWLAPFAGRLVVVGTAYSMGSVDRYVGLAHLAAGELDDAERWLGSGIELDRRVGARPFLVRGLAERALTLRRRGGPGDEEVAEAHLADASALIDELALGVPWSMHPRPSSGGS